MISKTRSTNRSTWVISLLLVKVISLLQQLINIIINIIKHVCTLLFLVYSFGSCGYHGPTGPTQFKCDSAYKSSSVKVKVISSGTLKGTQVWTVPENGTYG